jgi:hypothetical protein
MEGTKATIQYNTTDWPAVKMGIATESRKWFLLIWVLVRSKGHGPTSNLRARLPKKSAKIWDFDNWFGLPKISIRIYKGNLINPISLCFSRFVWFMYVSSNLNYVQNSRHMHLSCFTLLSTRHIFVCTLPWENN